MDGFYCYRDPLKRCSDIVSMAKKIILTKKFILSIFMDFRSFGSQNVKNVMMLKCK